MSIETLAPTSQATAPNGHAEQPETFQPGMYRMDYDRAEIRMIASTHGEYVYRVHACAKEPWTVAWIETMAPGDVLYDAGANTGPYSLVAASCGVRVFAFEPSAPSYARLVENVVANKMSRLVTCLPVALSDRTGLGLMNYATAMVGGSGHVFWTLDEDHQGEHKLARAPLFQQFVLSYRIDDLPGLDPRILRPPTHLKLDVDGAEVQVLLGARQTFRRPGFQTLLMEMDGPQEALLLEVASELGLEMIERHESAESGWRHDAQRGRKPIAYGIFRRKTAS